MIEDYLRELRASLRTRPLETERIIAEAEDHLAQAVAAGLAAGLTEIEAQEAAISAFGSVSEMVRAHTTHRVRLRVLAADLPMLAWKLTWLSLLGFGAAQLLMPVMLFRPGMVAYVISGGQRGVLPLQALSLLAAWQPGWVLVVLGLVLAVGYRLVRARRPAPLGGFFPLAAAMFFLLAIPAALAVGSVDDVMNNQQGFASVLAMAGLAAVYAARMAGTLIWQRTMIWERRAS